MAGLPSAPASRCHSPPSLEADTVRPALVEHTHNTTHLINVSQRLSAFSSDQDRDRKKDVEQNSALNSIVQILHIFFTCGFGDFFFIKRVQIWIRLDIEKMFLEKEKKSNATK